MDRLAISLIALMTLAPAACGSGVIHGAPTPDGAVDAAPAEGSPVADAVAQPDAQVIEPDAEIVCQPDCASKNCGDDGCGGSCGDCLAGSEYCDPAQTCVPCQTAVCGVCDELDISTIVGYAGQIGGDHAINALRAEVFSWPVTSDLIITQNATSTSFSVVHLPGESWQDTSNGYTDGAAMVACWDKVGVGRVGPMIGILGLQSEYHQAGLTVSSSASWRKRPTDAGAMRVATPRRGQGREFGTEGSRGRAEGSGPDGQAWLAVRSVIVALGEPELRGLRWLGGRHGGAREVAC
jgi:hypothetical protein